MPIPIAAIQLRAGRIEQEAQDLFSASAAGKVQDLAAMDKRIDWLIDAVGGLAGDVHSLADHVSRVAR